MLEKTHSNKPKQKRTLCYSFLNPPISKPNPILILILILLFRILLPPETSYPFIALISLNFLSFLCRCTRRFQDGVVRQSFGGDVFEERVRVEVVGHPFVEVWFCKRGVKGNVSR